MIGHLYLPRELSHKWSYLAIKVLILTIHDGAEDSRVTQRPYVGNGKVED